jgi:hypothetical protein
MSISRKARNSADSSTDACADGVTPAMTRRAPSSGARGSPGLRACGRALPDGLPEGLALPVDGLEGPGLAGAGLGLVGRLTFAAGFAATLATGFAAGLLAGGGDVEGGLTLTGALTCANADKLANIDATRTLVKANTRAEVEKRMALWRWSHMREGAGQLFGERSLLKLGDVVRDLR